MDKFYNITDLFYEKIEIKRDKLKDCVFKKEYDKVTSKLISNTINKLCKLDDCIDRDIYDFLLYTNINKLVLETRL